MKTRVLQYQSPRLRVLIRPSLHVQLVLAFGLAALMGVLAVVICIAADSKHAWTTEHIAELVGYALFLFAVGFVTFMLVFWLYATSCVIGKGGLLTFKRGQAIRRIRWRQISGIDVRSLGVVISVKSARKEVLGFLTTTQGDLIHRKWTDTRAALQ